MASVDGLVSGLNTSDIIAQLMQLERQPQTRLRTKQTTVESALGALRALNTKFLSVSTAAAKLVDPKGWQPATASTTDATKVAVTATAGAAQGSLSLHVTGLAAAGSFLSQGSVSALTGAGSTVAPASTTLHLKKGGGAAVPISSGDGSLAAVMKAINASGAGVTATAVQVTPGQYRLKLESTTTGLATGIKVGLTDGADDAFTAALGGWNTLTAPADATLRIGGVPSSRPSNTITDLVPGLTLTLLKADALDGNGDPTGPPTTVSVKPDNDKVAGQVAALVDAINAVNADIKAVTGYNLESGNKGKLYGDGTVRSLRDRLVATITGPGTALAGVSIDRSGTVTFDKDDFLKALAADPAAVQKALGAGTAAVPAGNGLPAVAAAPGLAARVQALAEGASRSASKGKAGLLTSAITSRESQVRTLKSSISDWDERLELRETTLKRQYSSLEKALGAAQSQGKWLSGQIASLG